VDDLHHLGAIDTSASVPRIGPAVITGEAIRMRRARPIAFAIRCDSSSPCPGVNHARIRCPATSSGRGSSCPLASTLRVAQSSSKFCANSAASSGASGTVRTTFS
jgi:hypothetical protein